MPTVPVTLPHAAYDVVIEPGALDTLGQRVAAVAPSDKACLIVDENIEDSYGRGAIRSLRAGGFETVVAVMPTGEDKKTLGTVRAIYEVLLDARLERSSPVVALGGGITGDTAGFVAASYLRGVPFIQAPTTLLAMVDASVGGKVGVNVPQGKNLVGAFWQPRLVVADVRTLGSLPDRELRCGLAECVKHGVIRDPSLLDWMLDHATALLAADPGAMATLVERNVSIKASVVADDEREQGARAHLNFGHTFGHAIEAATAYRYQHGEAVALGMLAATRLAVAQGLCAADVLERLTALLLAVGLPVVAPDLPAGDELLGRMQLDKKVRGGRVRFVLPRRLGEVDVLDGLPDDAVMRACDSLLQNP